VVQTAWLEAARFLCEGLDVKAHLGLENIERRGPGSHFLEDDMTLELLRSDEFFDSPLFDCDPGHQGRAAMRERAHQQVEELIAGFRSPVPGEVQEELRRFFHNERGRRSARG